MPHFRLRRNWWMLPTSDLKKRKTLKIGGYSCRLGKIRLMPNMQSGILKVTYLKQHVTTCLRSSSTNRDIHHCCLTFWSETATPYYNDLELSWSGFEHPIPFIRDRRLRLNIRNIHNCSCHRCLLHVARVV